MNLNSFSVKARSPVAAILLVAASTVPAVASPGAHGPNGEHLDSNQTGQLQAGAAPRLEAASELFELVARLEGGELSLLIDRFATNEPVLKADVEVESGSRKAKAKFHADLGDYAVDDPAMLQLLSTPGEHPVLITVLAGEDSDLLDGVLRVSTSQLEGDAGGPGTAGGDEHGHRHAANWWRWALVGVVVIAAALAWRWRRRSNEGAVARKLDGGRA